VDIVDDVSKVHAASIFRVEVSRVNNSSCICRLKIVTTADMKIMTRLSWLAKFNAVVPYSIDARFQDLESSCHG
jgi:hypothetical protein